MPEETSQASAAPASPNSSLSGKKNNSAVIIIIVVVGILVLGTAGYFVRRWIVRKAADKVASGILSAATGGSVSVDSNNNSASISSNGSSSTIGDNATWPSTMPSSVPKYSDGKITMSTKTDNDSGKSWSVIIGETNVDQFNAYKVKILAIGWRSVSETNFGAQIDSYENDSYDLSLTFDPSSNGVSIAVTAK
ncbi:MAG: hypothetical protein NTW79_00310 [Candidatus Berkelbacteria bacterium]|nr:hypothetical protein [Candidatus Berkelbacteria bacterium]